MVIAESAELLALDPSLDDETTEATAPMPPESAQFAAPTAVVSAPVDPSFPFDPATLTPEEAASLAGPLRVSLPDERGAATPAPAPTAPPAEIGGSRLAGRLLSVLPRRGDVAAARGRNLPAAGRLLVTFVVVVALLAIAGGTIADLLRPVPIIGSAIDTLQALTLYPSVYGLEWITATLAVLSFAGVVFAHMEQQAERHQMRKDPVRRLNISLATMLVLTVGSGAMSLMHDHGWAAAASATGFFVALCLAAPLARTPGARAMAPQPDRAWALLFLISLPVVIIASTLPTLLIAVLAFTHVRTRWSEVVDNTDEHADGPLDRTNRLGALVITAAVVIVAGIGFNAMHQSTDELRGLQQQERTAFPGALEGPTIDEPTP